MSLSFKLISKVFFWWFPICSTANAAHPLAVYVSNFDTSIAGENRIVAQYMSDAIETAFTRRPVSFQMLERRKYNEIVQRNKLEKDLQSLVHGAPASQRLAEELQGADAVVSGELRETRLDGVVLTVSLTKMNSKKIWQAQRKHTLYEWLNSDVRDRDAEWLASDAASFLLPAQIAIPDTDYRRRGAVLFAAGKYSEALPFLLDAAAVDVTDTQAYFMIGRCNNEIGDFTEATNALTAAIALNPKRADLFLERAHSFIGQNQNTRAIEDLDSAIRIDSGYLAALELRGDVFMSVERYEAAVAAYDAVYQQQPGKEVCMKLVAAYLRNGATNAAIVLERACATFR